MCVLAHVRIGGGEEIVKKMGLGDYLENGQVSVSSCLDSGSNYFIGLPARLSATSGAPALLSDEFMKYSWAAVLMTPWPWSVASPDLRKEVDNL